MMVGEGSKFSSDKAKLAFGFGAVVAFGTCIWLLITDRTTSATVAAALTIVLLLFLYFPVVESFEVFGLKAKLRHGVEELDHILANIRKTAEVSSKLLYIQIAWMNRMGSITWAKKRELLSDIDDLLDSVGISKREIANLKQPFLVMISRDLLSIFGNLIRFRVNHHAHIIESEKDQIFGRGPINQSDPRFLELSERRKAWSYNREMFDDILSDARLLDLEKVTKDQVASYPFPEQDLVIIECIRNKIVKLQNDCMAEGTITGHAEEFLESYDFPQDKLYKESFEGTG